MKALLRIGLLLGLGLVAVSKPQAQERKLQAEKRASIAPRFVVPELIRKGLGALERPLMDYLQANVTLPAYAYNPPQALRSCVYRQRHGLCFAKITDDGHYFLDEPDASLDKSGKASEPPMAWRCLVDYRHRQVWLRPDQQALRGYSYANPAGRSFSLWLLALRQYAPEVYQQVAPQVIQRGTQLGAESYLAKLNEQAVCGVSNWRLPNLGELAELIRMQTQVSGVWPMQKQQSVWGPDPEYFKAIPAGTYLTNSVHGTLGVWGIQIPSGRLQVVTPVEAFPVIAVAGNPMPWEEPDIFRLTSKELAKEIDFWRKRWPQDDLPPITDPINNTPASASGSIAKLSERKAACNEFKARNPAQKRDICQLPLDKFGQVVSWNDPSVNCVMDLQTGLVWRAAETKDELFNVVAKPLREAFIWAQQMTLTREIPLCDGINCDVLSNLLQNQSAQRWCGMAYWRLPNYSELQALARHLASDSENAAEHLRQNQYFGALFQSNFGEGLLVNGFDKDYRFWRFRYDAITEKVPPLTASKTLLVAGRAWPETEAAQVQRLILAIQKNALDSLIWH